MTSCVVLLAQFTTHCPLCATIAANTEGQKEVPELWIAATKGAKFYTLVVTELKNRGLHDILIASIDGLKRFLGVIEEVYPAGELQLWPVYMMRNSLNFTNRKRHKQVADDLRKVYKAVTFDNTSAALEAFPLNWEQQFKS